MSGAAKVNERLKDVPVEKYVSPTTISINLKKFPSMDASDVEKRSVLWDMVWFVPFEKTNMDITWKSM